MPVSKSTHWLSFLLAFSLSLPSVRAAADDGVYAHLPDDTSVVSYATGDMDADGLDELVLHFRSAGQDRLAAFAGRGGRWTPWWMPRNDEVAPKGGKIFTVRLIDANGDGRQEVAVSSLTAGLSSMITRVMAFGENGPDGPVFDILLEDATSPPGYALFGQEEGRPAVTFLNMGSGGAAPERANGFRRVHCWDGSAFQICREVLWELK